MYELFSNLMFSVSSASPLEYICYFLMCMATFGAFMRFLYTLFSRW